MNSVEHIRSKKKIRKIKILLKKSNFRDYLMFLIGINSGLRISDILKLKVADVVNKDFIEVCEKKTGKYRRFPITNSFKEPLNEYIQEMESKEWLFGSPYRKKPISRIQAYRIIHKACKKAGVQTKIGTHTLRKTFGYHFYNKYKDIALLQSILNHSNPQITMRYIGINQDIMDISLKAFKL